MFSIGEYVISQTGNLGKVIGYGHQMVDRAYMLTVKVLVDCAKDSHKKGGIQAQKRSHNHQGK